MGGLLTYCVVWWTCESRGANLFIGAKNVSVIVLARTVRSGLGTGSMLRKSDITSVRAAEGDFHGVRDFSCFSIFRGFQLRDYAN